LKARYQFLLDHAMNLSLSAVEIYNKPDFKGREAIFAVLMVSAWEVLLKARIVKNNNNSMNSIYVREQAGIRWKRNRNGGFLTIGLHEAICRCGLAAPVVANLEEMTKIRDASLHLVCPSPALPYIVFTLGSATLQNFSKVAREWFNHSFSDYNFYILPLSFEYPFKTISVLDMKQEPDCIARLIESVRTSQENYKDDNSGFFFTCEIEVKLTSAKKISDPNIPEVSVTRDAAGTIIHRLIDLLDKYPYTYSQVLAAIKCEVPSVNQTVLSNLINKLGIKGDKQYAEYNFRNNQERQRGPKPNTAIIYNHNFIKFAISSLAANARPQAVLNDMSILVQ